MWKRFALVLLIVTMPVMVAASETVRVAGIAPDATLTLTDGRTLRLSGIAMPAPAAERTPDRALAQAVVRRLQDWAGGRDLVLADVGADRYGRVVAHAFADGGTWLQGALLAEGLARVRTTPDETARAAAMLLIEDQARNAGCGVWARPAYAVRPAADVATLERDADSFQIVVGRVVRAEKRSSIVYIDFGEDWRTDTTAVLDRAAQRRFTSAGIDPLSLAGSAVRLRGWIDSYNGPRIRITHPEQIERVVEP